MLEESSFANRKADYFWLLFLSSLMLLVRNSFISTPTPPSNRRLILFLRSALLYQGLSPLFNLPFLSSPLAYVPIYFWSRRHPTTPISLFGLLTITAPYLPFALVAFSWVLTGTWRAAASDLVGCAVGHVGWFIRDVWTREMVGGSTILSEAPDAL
jgi:Derlin-2/3